MDQTETGQNYPNSYAVPAKDGGTTREMPARAPNYPFGSLVLLAAQVIVAAAGLYLLATAGTTREYVVGAVVTAVAVAMFALTQGRWGWWARYPKSRILTHKKLQTLQPGMWVAQPGGEYAVRMREVPTGMQQNPVVADGMTWDELQIMAPVYVFTEAPKGSHIS